MQSLSTLIRRAQGKTRRTLASHLHCRKVEIAAPRAIVSFSFDDAPRSAFETGGAILEQHAARGTYFVSLGLAGTTTEIGAIGGPVELERALERGHELGCHTFDHDDAWFTDTATYIGSVDRNRAALQRLLPGRGFRTFAYPKSGATAAVKPALGQRFDCCRAGGQTFNSGSVDLNLLSACFLDRRAAIGMRQVGDLIDRNAQAGGWLIFAAHDISEADGAFGCSPSFFAAVVRRAVDSGASVLPVASACASVLGAAFATHATHATHANHPTHEPARR